MCSEIGSYSAWLLSFRNCLTQLPRRMWETTSKRQQISLPECESHACVHSSAVLVKVFEIPTKRNAVYLFSTLILNEDDRYCRIKSPTTGLCLYLLSRKHFSVGTIHCFLQQNKSFGFDLQHKVEPIIGVQNWFKRYAELNILIILFTVLRPEIPAVQIVM